MHLSRTLLELQQLLIQKNQSLIAFLKQDSHPPDQLFDLYEELNVLREEIKVCMEREIR